MDGSIRLSDSDRKVLLKLYRYGDSRQTARRAHVVLLKATGHTWQEIRAVLFCSNDLISAALKQFRENGVTGLQDAGRFNPVPFWLTVVIRWVSKFSPQDFSYFRTRWTCELLAELLWWEHGLRVGRERIRRGLAQMGFVWRRPRPIVGPNDPNYDDKLNAIQHLLRTMPDDETAVFQDEVDVNLNPKIGAAWMRCGEQATVSTPGNNVKRYVFGSLHWRTGTLITTSPSLRRNTTEFLRHLDDLRHRLRSYRRIHVICDNASFHSSRAVREYLAKWGDRIAIHFLPCYAPETNPIERVWWHMHETVTRNHQCATIDDLVDQVYDWFATQRQFEIKTTVPYPLAV